MDSAAQDLSTGKGQSVLMSVCARLLIIIMLSRVVLLSVVPNVSEALAV